MRCSCRWEPRKDRGRIRQRHGESRRRPRRQGAAAIDGIVELLAGKPNDLSKVVLDLEGVPEFHRGVYDIARSIPPGKTMTYGDIARRLGGVELSRESARRSDATRARSWCPAIACSPPAASPADFPPMAASSPN